MNHADALREKLKKFIGKEFTSEDLKPHNDLTSLLSKMERRHNPPEVYVIRWEQHKGQRRAHKVYRVGVLREPTERRVRVNNLTTKFAREEASLHPTMEPWRNMWPELFRVPQFNIKGTTQHVAPM